MKKQRQHPYIKHSNHIIEFDTTEIQVKPNFSLVHSGRLFCKQCKVQIKWLSQHEVDCINQWEFSNRTLEYFLRHTKENTMSTDYPVWLNVPYKEKDRAKSLGAQWNHEAKCWYININSKRIIDLVDYLPVDEHLLTKIAKRHNIL